jgi:hypothetical protein
VGSSSSDRRVIAVKLGIFKPKRIMQAGLSQAILTDHSFYILRVQLESFDQSWISSRSCHIQPIIQSLTNRSCLCDSIPRSARHRPSPMFRNCHYIKGGTPLASKFIREQRRSYSCMKPYGARKLYSNPPTKNGH